MKNRSMVWCAAVVSGLAGSAWGQDDAFWQAGDGVWSTAASWSLGVVPNNNGDQLFNASLLSLKNPYTVTADIDVTIENLTLSGAGVTLDLADSMFTVNQNASLSGGTLTRSGQGSDLNISGSLALSDMALVGAGNINVSGGVNIMSSANTDICNTCIDTGGSSTLSGPGGLSLNQGGDLTNNEGGTLSIVADQNRNITGDGTGTLSNRGTLNTVATGRGFTNATFVSGVNFENTGTLNVFAGQLLLNTSNNLAPGQTLSQGTWNVYDGALLSLGDSTFNRLETEVNIRGADANFQSISLLNTVGSDGRFGIYDGYDFTTNAKVLFDNNGTVEVGLGSRFDAANGGLGNLDGDAIFGGTFIVGGTFLTGANEIRFLGADLTLIGADSVFSGIGALNQIGSSGRLALLEGRDFGTVGDLDVNDGGTVLVGLGSTLQITGLLVNNSSAGVFDAAAFEVAGTLVASNLNILEISNELILDGIGSQLLDSDGNDAISNLQRIREDGILRLRNGRSLDNLDSLIVDGILSIEGAPGTGAASRGSAPGTVRVAGTTVFTASSTLEIIINGSTDELYGQLVSGSVEILDGATLALMTDPDAQLRLGDELVLVKGDAVIGSFSRLLGLDIGGGLSFEIVQDASGVFARVVPAPGFGAVLLGAGLMAARRRRG